MSPIGRTKLSPCIAINDVKFPLVKTQEKRNKTRSLRNRAIKK